MQGYTLIITEKPDAANRIALALDSAGAPRMKTTRGVPYYEATNNGRLIVVPALGHLYTIMQQGKSRHDYPVFNYQWVPLSRVKRKSSMIDTWIKVIAELARNADSFVDACDFDVEGNIIGYNILKYACGEKEQIAKRMKYSTLTIEELQKAYTDLVPKLDFQLIEAGLTRHEIDWLYGINLSRALMQATKSVSGKFATFSTGRVQGPALRFLETREKSLRCFVPTPYWSITSKVEIEDKLFEIEYEKKVGTMHEAIAIRDSAHASEGRVENINVKDYVRPAPVPFDLTTLQSEAYRLFKYSPKQTSESLQSLYLSALISYPRTSSQKLPPSIGYRDILRKITKIFAYKDAAIELLSKSTLKPTEGRKIDSAHPAIYPTGNFLSNLKVAESKIFDLVIKRFLAVFAEVAVFRNFVATIDIGGNGFVLSVEQTIMEGWLRYYKPYILPKTEALPKLNQGQIVKIKESLLDSQFTKPPPRYNPRSLLLKMEKEGIGTKSTRAAIIETLQKRKYIKGASSLSVSDLGFEVTEVLAKYCPSVVSPEMTRKLEHEMDEICHGTKTRKIVLQKAVEEIENVSRELKNNESVVGIKLSKVLSNERLNERTVGICPICANGKLVVLRSKKSGKRFVGCTNFFQKKCNIAFSLPQVGIVKPLGSTCKICGSPNIAIIKKRKPWKMCLDPKCSSKGVHKFEM